MRHLGPLDQEIRDARQIRRDLINAEPNQWPILLGQAERRLDLYGFDNLYDFCTGKRRDNGLGMKVEQVERLLFYNPGYKVKSQELWQRLSVAARAKGVEELGHNGEYGVGRPKDNSFADSVNSKAKWGSTSAKYRMAKLKRDHPEIAERLEAGEFKTVIEAERAAGIAEPKRQRVRFEVNPDKPAEGIWRAIKRFYPDDPYQGLQEMIERFTKE